MIYIKIVVSFLILISGSSYAFEEFSTGVSTEAISKPNKDATISGLGQSSITDGNTGSFRQKYPIELPKGINGFTPSLAVSYNSSSGQGILGQGFSLGIPVIERSTLGGSPKYTEADLLWGPDQELVKIDKTETDYQYFSPLINKTQSLYKYSDNLDKWGIHTVSGKELHFGSSSSSKIETSKGSFKWYLDKEVDTYGNEIAYEYSNENGYPYLTKISYAYKSGSSHYSVEFSYEVRDDIINSYRSTELVQIKKRLSDIVVKSGGSHIIRHYTFDYNQLGNSKLSFLSKIDLLGENNVDVSPSFPATSFSFSENNIDSNRKTQILSFDDTRDFPPSFSKGRANLIDINRDSLPDFIETSPNGAKVWINSGQNGFLEHYRMDEFISILGGKNSKLMDVNGDRIVDFVTSGLNPSYYEGGIKNGNQFYFDSIPKEIVGMPSYSINIPNVKTIDLNGDGRLDILTREPNSFHSFISGQAGLWEDNIKLSINTSAFGLDSKYTYFSDMDGDGLVDLTFIRKDRIIYFSNQGNGEFSDPKELFFTETNPEILKRAFISKFVFITDINADGLGDILVAGEKFISFSLNLGNGQFGATSNYFNVHDSEFNNKGLHITLADMNGNGTTDVVWSNDFHDFRYLDILGEKSFLLNEIDNGLGHTKIVKYKTAVEYNQDVDSLEPELSISKYVVSEIEEYFYDETTPFRKAKFLYSGGYFSGIDNEFRGFNLVEKITYGDSSIGDRLDRFFFEQGRIASQNIYRSMLLESIVQEYDTGTSTKGEIFQKIENSFDYKNSFPSLNPDLDPVFPFISDIVTTEGDGDSSTSSRSYLKEMDYTLDSDGYIQSKVEKVYSDLSTLYKTTETTFAVSNYDSNFIGNRPCQIDIKDSSNNVLESKRFYYDLQSHCSVTKGSLTEAQNWNGSNYYKKSSYTYKSFGSLASFDDALNNTTTVNYDSLDLFPTSVVNPLGHTVSASYDTNNGLMTTYTDENSVDTDYEFDAFLRIEKIIGPTDTTSLPTMEYLYTFGSTETSPSKVEVKTREKSGTSGTHDVTKYFDALGRAIGEISEGVGSNHRLQNVKTYNVNDKPIKEYLPKFVSSFSWPGFSSTDAGSITNYDILMRVTANYNPQHTSSNHSVKITTFKVGESTHKDEEGNETKTEFDIFGRKIKLIDADLSEIDYEYDERNLLEKITDPQGSITIFGYDYEGRRVCKLDPTIGLNLYEFNNRDNITKKTAYGYVASHTTCSAPSGVTPRKIDFTYDDLGRNTLIDFPAGSGTTDLGFGFDSTSVTYGVGKLTSTSFEGGSKILEYDILGNLTKTHLTTSLGTHTTEKIYDVMGRLEKLIYPTVGSNTLSVKYEYDNATNLLKVSNDSTSAIYVENILYNPLNQLTEIEFGNDVKTTYSYDDSDNSYRLENIFTEAPIPFTDLIKNPIKSLKNKFITTIQDIDFTYAENDNILTRVDNVNTVSESYTYDNLNRITDADIGTDTNEWSYDEIGNITSRGYWNGGTYTTDSYSYNTNRKQILTIVAGQSYSFDVYGNLTSDGTRSITWNYDNRAITIVKGGVSTSYTYDEEGIRVQKNVAGVTTTFLTKVTEVRGSDVVRHIMAGNKRIASIDENGDVTFNHQDHQLSGNLRTDSSGAVVKRIEYYPFGRERLSSGSYNKIFNQYTDQYKDGESDLYYYNQRYYNPILGRFISGDPLYLEEMDERGMDTQEVNVFGYVRNNPLKYIDPTGMLTEKDYFLLSFLKPNMEKSMTKILINLENKGFQPKVLKTYRTFTEQQNAVNSGASSTMNSKHRTSEGIDVQDRRFGYNDVNNGKLGPAAKFYKAFGNEVEGAGLKWGGNFTPRNDLERANSAITGYGWDPGHAESAGGQWGTPDDLGTTSRYDEVPKENMINTGIE